MTAATAAAALGTGQGMYYGRKVLIALFFAGFMVYGGGLYCFVLFIPPLTAEFHWNRAATSGLVTVFWLSAPLILLGGAAIKRVGAMRLLIAGIVIEALCVASLSTVSTFAEMYVLRGAMGVGKVMFAVTLPYVISRWFARDYSLGLGIAWAGWHVGGMVLAPLTGAIIAGFGWRPACLAIAAGLLTVGLLPVLATLRYRSPAQLGLGLDGVPLGAGHVVPGHVVPGHVVPGHVVPANVPPAAPAASAAAATAAAEAPAGTLGAVLGSPTFWLIALVTLFFYATYGGLLTQESSVVEGAGFSPRLSSLVLGSTAGFAAIGGLASGWLLDRYSIRAVGFAMNVLLLAGAASLLLVGRLHAVAALVSYAVCFGITIGGSDIYFVAVLRRRFPDVSVAFTYSAWYFCEIFTLFAAGPAAGKVFDLTGNYDLTLALLAGCAALAFALSFLIWRKAGLATGSRAAQ